MIDHSDVARIAALSRIALTPTEAERIGDDIEKIIHYVSEIRGASVLAPTPGEGGALREQTSETGMTYNILREDGGAHAGGVYSEALLSGVPTREGNYVKVKKIL